MPVIIPPSPRPLLLWLATAAICAAILTLEGVTLLTLWRQSSRPWRLGLASVGAGALGIALTGRILAAYHDLAPIGACYTHGCEGFFPLVTHAVAASLTLSGSLAVFTIASVMAALALSALDGASRQSPSSAAAWSVVGRFSALLCYTLVIDAGAYWMVEGIANWMRFAYLANPQAAGDGLGEIPLISAVFETIGGAVVLGMGVYLLWMFLRRAGAPQPQAA